MKHYQYVETNKAITFASDLAWNEHVTLWWDAEALSWDVLPYGGPMEGTFAGLTSIYDLRLDGGPNYLTR